MIGFDDFSIIETFENGMRLKPAMHGTYSRNA